MKENIHIGKIIKAELERQGRKQCWLAQQIHCDSSNICKILNRSSIDTDTLLKISKALETNLFTSYNNEIDKY